VKVLHCVFVALGLLTLAWAAPAGVGLTSETGPVQRDAATGSSGGRHRYVFIGGFHGGK
jgi:hypothetical protein